VKIRQLTMPCLGKVRAVTVRNQEREYRYFLRRLFTTIPRSGASGPIASEPVELPDSVSFRRLEFDASGVMRLRDSPLRARLEELYALLEGAEGTRVRECPGCKRLFWAWRQDQQGCNRVCANRLRFRRFYHRSR
jgi:hypothetical protein